MKIHIQKFDFNTADHTDWENLLEALRHTIEEHMQIALWRHLDTYTTDDVSIYISDEHPTKDYGVPGYDYVYLKEWYKRLWNSELPMAVRDALKAIWNVYIRLMENSNCKMDVSLRDVLQEMETVIAECKAQDPYDEDHLDRNQAQEILDFCDAIANRRRTVLTLGKYRHPEHQITIYIENIRTVVENNPSYVTNDEKIAKVVSVFAHELFHAYHATQIDTWNDLAFAVEHNRSDAGSSALTATRVKESLAKWFEYVWCLQSNQVSQNKEYRPVIQDIQQELRNEVFPGWPYAGAAAIIENKTILTVEDIFHASLTNWHISYSWIKKGYAEL